jgi:hypothetical protein
MARSDRTKAKQLRVIGGGQLMPNWLLRRRLKTLLLLASISITPTAAAQQQIPAEIKISDSATKPAPGTNNAPVAITTIATNTAARYRQASQTAASPLVTPPLSTPTAPSVTWPVQTSLKNTLHVWAQRQGWPAPRFLTEADWAVDVPGSVAGTIEDALKALAEGFGQSPTRPRIEVTGNHVIMVSEVGAE